MIDMDRSPQTRLGLFLLGALIAGSISGSLIAERYPFFAIPADLQNRIEEAPLLLPEELVRELSEARLATDRKNAAATSGLFGMILACTLGSLAGCVNKSWKTALAGCLSGITLGGLLGVAGGMLAPWVEENFNSDSTYRAMLSHGIIWSCAGIGCGVAVGIPDHSLTMAIRKAGAALVGGLAAALLYAPSAAVFFPMEKSDQIVPTGMWNQIYWSVLPAGLITLMIGGLRTRSSRDHATPA